jgi:exopolysaccharide biosynthesis polyprenyl glycosylphosphotransferase
VNETRRRLLLNALKLFDLGLIMAAFVLTVLIVYARHGSLAHFLSMRVKLGNFAIFSLTVLAWHLVFSSCGMYGSKRLSTRGTEVADALKAATLCTVSLALVAGLFSVSMVTPRFSVIFWILSSASITVGRLLLRDFLRWIRREGHNLRHMLILGTNARALEFARGIEASPELGYRILGFVDEDWPKIGEFEKIGRPLACDFGALPEFLRHNVVDEVVNYLPLRSFYEHASQVAALCELHGIILRFNSDIFGLKSARAQAGEFNGNHYIISHAGGIRDGLPMMMKRALDVLGSLLLLLLLAPLFSIVALVIKLTSEGDVFFLQERVGYNKRKFLIYKFRTMVPNAEKMMAELENLNEVSGPVFKIKNDPRMTRIGKLLRRTSIDELPQLFNVLKGDMSLVGPRPLPVRDYQGFNEDWQRRRFSVRPGITCLWQVTGRCSITFEQWMKLDLQYLDEWSLWLDLKILARTIPAVLKGSGAA